MTRPSYWQLVWDEAQPKLIKWADVTGKEVCNNIPRVGQLDAELLDEELTQTLQEPLAKAFNLINNSFRTRLEPELGLLIRAILYKLSLWDLGATYGAKLQDLQYVCGNSTNGKLTSSGLPRLTLLMHGCATILLPYVHQRLRSFALSNAWPDAPSYDKRRRAWELLSRLEAIHSSAALLSFIAFLWNGKYRTLADRLMSMKLVPVQRFSSRQVSYEFMNRQMVWHAFTEFLLLVLPLFRLQGFRRSYNRLTVITNGLRESVIPRSHSSSATGKTGSAIRKGKFFDLPSDQCAICADKASTSLVSHISNGDYTNVVSPAVPDVTVGTTVQEAQPPSYPITTPYAASCGHLYCYFCLSEALLRAVDDGEQSWTCLRCSDDVRSCERTHALCVDGSVHTSDGWASDEGGLTSFESDLSFDSESELLET